MATVQSASDGIFVKNAQGSGDTDDDGVFISPGSQGVWFVVKGDLGGGTVSLFTYLTDGTPYNIASKSGPGDSVEVLPVGKDLYVAWDSVTDVVIEVLPIGGY